MFKEAGRLVSVGVGVAPPARIALEFPTRQANLKIRPEEREGTAEWAAALVRLAVACALAKCMEAGDDVEQAPSLGFTRDENFDDVLRQFIRDDVPHAAEADWTDSREECIGGGSADKAEDR